MGASRRWVRFGARVYRTWENDCSASEDAGMRSDECGRTVEESSFSAIRTGRMVHGTEWEATTELGSHGVIATCWMRSESNKSPLIPALVNYIHSMPQSHYIPEALKPGNRSVKRSSESTPTSPFMRSSSSRRAEIAGRSSRLLRRLLRGWGTPFGASILVEWSNA